MGVGGGGCVEPSGKIRDGLEPNQTRLAFGFLVKLINQFKQDDMRFVYMFPVLMNKRYCYTHCLTTVVQTRPSGVTPGEYKYSLAEIPTARWLGA